MEEKQAIIEMLHAAEFKDHERDGFKHPVTPLFCDIDVLPLIPLV